jgi:hypothetical protein
MSVQLFSRIVWNTFLWVAMLGGLLGLITGILLILNNPLLFRIGERMNVWISTRQAMRGLDVPINVEASVYRYHRIAGVLIFLGAVYTLYVLVLRFKGPELVSILARLLRLQVAVWLADSLRVFLIVVNAAAAVIAVVMIARPSALKGLESWANRHYSARKATRQWEILRAGPDELVRAYPRTAGIALAIAGAYVFLSLGYLRFIGH